MEGTDYMDLLAKQFAESREVPIDSRETALGIQNSQPGAPALVLLISDTHVGQNVGNEETGGFGNYDIRQYCYRLRNLEQTVLRLLNEKVDGHQAERSPSQWTPPQNKKQNNR